MMNIRKGTFLPFVWIIIIFLGLLSDYENILEKVYLNLAAASSIDNSVFKNILYATGMSEKIHNASTCRTAWYLGFIHDQRGNIQERNQNWGEAVVCDPELVHHLFNLYPDDKQLAEYIHSKQPYTAESWFWIGDLNPEKRLEYYLNGTAYGTTNGRRWIELGRMLGREGDLPTALQAFLQGCYNGDPGHNACWSAGKVAEELGDYKGAIQYYRLSKWGVALDRAKELEHQGY